MVGHGLEFLLWSYENRNLGNCNQSMSSEVRKKSTLGVKLLIFKYLFFYHMIQVEVTSQLFSSFALNKDNLCLLHLALKK